MSICLSCRHIETAHRHSQKQVTERPTGVPVERFTDIAHNILMSKYKERDKFANATHGNIKVYIHIFIYFRYIKQRGGNSHNEKHLTVKMDNLTALSKLTMYSAGNSLSESTWNFILTLLKPPTVFHAKLAQVSSTTLKSA